MRIPTKQIPQADRLDIVESVVAAIGRGEITYQGISRAIGYDERQGRYYRLASELLGLTERGGVNSSVLTALGREWVDSDPVDRRRIITQAVLRSSMMQRVMPFFESRTTAGCTPEEIDGFIEDVTAPTGPTMVPRRRHTIVSWLEYLGLLVERHGRYYLQPVVADFGVVRYDSDVEPLLPRRFDLSEYSALRKRVSEPASTLEYSVKRASVERANGVHGALVDLVAERIRRCGSVPRSNGYVDLAASIRDIPHIFEMKSTTPANTQSQIRRGLAQLYEYRYLQDAPSARLVLVIENPVPPASRWMVDYLIKDRQILLLWDGAGTLFCDRRQMSELDILL